MSSFYSHQVTCPVCNTASDFTIYNSINTTLNPELKEKVLSGEIFDFYCPNCGERHGIFFPFLYHDMDASIMIFLVEPNDVNETVEMFNSDTDLFGKEMNKYTKRIVSDIPFFLEKLQTLTKGFDDKCIEIFKLISALQLQQSDPDVEFDNIVFDFADGEPMLFLVNNGEDIASMPFAMEVYDKIKESYDDVLSIDNDYIIDNNWAANFLEKYNN